MIETTHRATWFQRYGAWIVALGLAVASIIGTSWQYRTYVDANTDQIKTLEIKVDTNTKDCIKAASERSALQMFLNNLKNSLEKRLDKFENKLDNIRDKT
jgi:ribosome-associated translation inhibitor RaiA